MRVSHGEGKAVPLARVRWILEVMTSGPLDFFKAFNHGP
jgi:hypothetical protein